MTQAPTTRVSLLLRIRDPRDHGAWQQFADLYSATIYGYLRRRGLQDADAADLMQDVLRSIAVAIGRFDYDTQRGTFRSWIFTVTRNKLFNFTEARRNQPRGSGDSGVQEQLAEALGVYDETDDAWNREWQLQLAAKAMENVQSEFQPATWKAFQLAAVEGKAAKDVSSATGLSVGAVYVAKSRVIARLKSEIERLSDEVEGA